MTEDSFSPTVVELDVNRKNLIPNLTMILVLIQNKMLKLIYKVHF